MQNLSDNESQVSNIRQEKCPTIAIKKFRKTETVNLIRLKQTVKTNTEDDEHNENTEETIKKAEKDFALDLPMLVDETARDVKILSAIAALEKDQPEDIFSPCRRNRSHLTTRFGLIIPTRSSYQKPCERQLSPCPIKDTHPQLTWINQRQLSGGPVSTKKYGRKQKIAPAAEPQVRTS